MSEVLSFRAAGRSDVGLVREAVVERGLLTQNAPHLVKNQSFEGGVDSKEFTSSKF